MDDNELVGREEDLERVRAALDGVHNRGAALLVRGDPGVGKSALLRRAVDFGDERGMRVLRGDGALSEIRLAHAALHKLLRPLMPDVDGIASHLALALRAAVHAEGDAHSESYLVGLATLELLAEAAAQTPLLVVVDDAQWLDDESAQVLAFVARRLDADPIVLLVASRSDEANVFSPISMIEIGLCPLDDRSSTAVLDQVAPGLSTAQRSSILEAAQGNPLALVELPRASAPDEISPAPWMPLTERLERTFATRIQDLPPSAMPILLAAAASDSDSLPEIHAAARILSAEADEAVDLDSAMASGLLDFEGLTCRFRHPLVRSALYRSAEPSRRRAAHLALAQVLEAQPDRRIWHQAVAAISPDETLASELEGIATHAASRGASTAALAAFDTALRLTASAEDRQRRLRAAAELAYDSGLRDEGDRLRRELAPLVRSARDQLELQLLAERADLDLSGAGDRVLSLLSLARSARDAGETDLALEFLRAAAYRSWMVGLGSDTNGAVLDALDSLGRAPDDQFARVAILSYVAPISSGPEIAAQLDDTHIGEADATSLPQLAHAASCLGEFEIAERLFARAADELRRQGRLHALARVLALQAWSTLRRGLWATAVPAADEARKLAEETGQPPWQATALAALAMVAALRGNEQDALANVAEAERLATARDITVVLAVCRLARGAVEAGAGRHEKAFEELRHIRTEGDPAHHPMQALWSVGSFVEAAVMSGHHDEAAAYVREVEPVVSDTSPVVIAFNVAYARALVSNADAVNAAYREALQLCDSGWVFERSRIELSYGAWLRRERRVTQSREVLRAARDGFDHLDALPRADRARGELRASGEQSSGRTLDAWHELSPQEMHIARLAADGLSNKEIGQRLYLSHRTIANHLYRIFPKLGITSRIQLSAVPLGDD